MATLFSMYAAKCPHCAARLSVSREAEQVTCEYCSTTIMLQHKSRPRAPQHHAARPQQAAPPVAQVRASRVIVSIIAASALVPIGIAAFAIHATRGSGEPSTETQSATASAVATSEEPADPDALLGEKLRAIVACVADSGLASRERYLAWVDPEGGPTGRERHIQYGVFEVHFSDSCDETLRGANALEPALPGLDAAAMAYAEAMKPLARATSEAAEYYSGEGYKDDGAARGRELHPELMKGFAAHEETLRSLLGELTPVADALLERETAAAKASGDLPLYWGRKAFLTARDLVTLSDAMDETGVASLDQDRFSSALDQLLADVGMLKETDAESRLASVHDGFAGLLKHAKGLRRMAAKSENFRASQRKSLGTSAGWMIDYSPARIRYEYRSVLQSQGDLFGGGRVVDLDTTAGARLRAAARAAPAESLQAEASVPRGETMATTAAVRKPGSKSTGASAAPEPSGPVLSVGEARPLVTARVIECMRQHKVHSLQARMGNKAIGPVHVLGKPYTSRVDGLRTKLVGSGLGRCMDEAGKTVRARAFKSDYILLNLTNDAVPNPLAGLPERSDRKEVEATIDTALPQIRECGKKHGQEGAQAVFYFTIDGPTGEVISARAGYGSDPFKKCTERVYRALTFKKVQQPEYKHTRQLRL